MSRPFETPADSAGSARPDVPTVVEAEAPSSQRLHGTMSTTQLVFLILAFTAPVATMAGVIPLGIAFGGGAGTPLILLALAVMMLIFAPGYLVMARKLPRAGALYTFVTAGIGRPMGLAASFIAILSYTLATFSLIAFIGLTLGNLVPSVPWWVWSLIAIPIVGFLGYLRIDVSAKILAVILGLGFVLVVVYDAVVIFGGASQGFLSTEPFDVTALLGNSGAVIAVALLITTFGGFESTAIYADEVKNPRRTIPRATYIAIVAIAIFYGIGAFAMLTAFGGGTDGALAISADPSTAFLLSVGQYLGTVLMHVTSVLVLASVFAGYLAAHNILARYVFNLGVDRILPPAIGVSHPRFGSPSRASVAITVITLIFFVLAAVTTADVAILYAVILGIGGLLFIVLLVLGAIGIASYLLRTKPADANVWQRQIAPVLAVVLMIALLIAVALSLDLLTGGGALTIFAIVLPIVAIILGVVVGLVVRSRRPEIYKNIGTRE